jgi:hypothetical protein
MTKILRFEMNVPAEVALKCTGPGKSIEGRYGNRVMYTLTDDRLMYVAPIVASRITDLGLHPGEPFQICKQLKKQGQRRLIEWKVQRLECNPNTHLEQKLRESIEIAKAAQATDANDGPDLQPATQEGPALSNISSVRSIVPGSSSSGNSRLSSADGHSSPTAIDDREDAPTTMTSAPDQAGSNLGCTPECGVPSLLIATRAVLAMSNGSTHKSPSPTENGNSSPPVTTKLEHALKTAISAAFNAEKYGAELGYVMRFDADAIKSMAITVLINMSEGGRR